MAYGFPWRSLRNGTSKTTLKSGRLADPNSDPHRIGIASHSVQKLNRTFPGAVPDRVEASSSAMGSDSIARPAENSRGLGLRKRGERRSSPFCTSFRANLENVPFPFSQLTWHRPNSGSSSGSNSKVTEEKITLKEISARLCRPSGINGDSTLSRTVAVKGGEISFGVPVATARAGKSAPRPISSKADSVLRTRNPDRRPPILILFFSSRPSSSTPFLGQVEPGRRSARSCFRPGSCKSVGP